MIYLDTSAVMPLSTGEAAPSSLRSRPSVKSLRMHLYRNSRPDTTRGKGWHATSRLCSAWFIRMAGALPRPVPDTGCCLSGNSPRTGRSAPHLALNEDSQDSGYLRSCD